MFASNVRPGIDKGTASSPKDVLSAASSLWKALVLTFFLLACFSNG
jgi:hypothetical protein